MWGTRKGGLQTQPRLLRRPTQSTYGGAQNTDQGKVANFQSRARSALPRETPLAKPGSYKARWPPRQCKLLYRIGLSPGEVHGVLEARLSLLTC